PLLIAGLLGVVAVLRVLSSSLTAGFVIKEFTWYQYLFTQFRVIWLYVRLFFLPVGLNADYDLTASKNILDQGAVLGLVGLLIAAAVAWRYRREFPLASFGFFGMLLLLAPTSSVVPIRDVAVERRLYLPFVCLVLIALDLLRRWKVSRPVLAGLLAALTAGAAVATHQRSQVWSNSLALWEDTLAKSPHNTRALFQLAHAQWESGQCDKAATTYERVSASGKYPDDIPINWSLALECAGKPDDAVAKLQQAAARKPSAHIFATIGMVRAKQGRPGEALDALATAEKLDPAFDMTYVYRGNVYLSQNNIAGAESEFNRALSINGSNQPAREALVRLRRIPR
ncbi:MAG TPA: tetratricopeptide repeat protein, partial [Bryobacteraceae bacterium]|nr:tetratricopeptide repeat protein [Bryobacteraceae bacterium]